MSVSDYLPLSVDSSGGYVAPGKFFITGSDGVEIVATCHNGKDAEFIVRACNSHEALVEACRAALPFARQYGANGFTASIIEAALALAEGK